MSAAWDSGCVDPRPRLVPADGGYTVAGVRCLACQYAVAHPRPRCPRCGGEVEEAHFGPHGTVWAASVVHVSLEGLPAPYTVAYVDLDDGPRVLLHVNNATAVSPPVGARVTLSAISERGDPVCEPFAEVRA